MVWGEIASKYLHEFLQHCAKLEIGPLDFIRLNSMITNSDQAFKSANKFWDALYLMALVWKFQYKWATNNYAHISIVCRVGK